MLGEGGRANLLGTARPVQRLGLRHKKCQDVTYCLCLDHSSAERWWLRLAQEGEEMEGPVLRIEATCPAGGVDVTNKGKEVPRGTRGLARTPG